MRALIAGMALWVAVVTGYVPTAVASQAQAALTGRIPDAHYTIPQGLTPEEQYWFKVFQEGNFLSEGWQEISAEILAKTPPDQRPAQRVALENLGNKIGLAWCRSNDIRKVDSTMLQEWGDILRKTARKNPQQLAKAIAYIDQEVDDAVN